MKNVNVEALKAKITELSNAQRVLDRANKKAIEAEAAVERLENEVAIIGSGGTLEAAPEAPADPFNQAQ